MDKAVIAHVCAKVSQKMQTWNEAGPVQLEHITEFT
jgi:hypothetical protein